MKQLVRSLVAGLSLLLSSAAALAQTPTAVPNGSFETWEQRNPQRLVPRSWITTEDLLEPVVEGSLPALGFVNRVAEAQEGSFAVALANVVLPSNAGDLILPGFVGTGTPTSVGVPYTARPARLQFWYRLTGPQAALDSAYVGASLFRNISGRSQAIAGIGLLLPPASAYTLVSEALEYTPLGVSPDTLLIEALSGLADELHAGTVLTLDAVQLTGTVTATRSPVAEAALQIYPNPSATGEFSLASLTDAALSTAPFTVTDATGRVVLRQVAAPASASRGRLVDLRNQSPGVYLLQLNTAAGPVTRKLVIQ